MPEQTMSLDAQVAYDTALRRMREWRRRENYDLWLDLSGLGLTTLPPEIGRLSMLRTLHLSNNRLKTLPPEIGKLTSLRGLSIYDNHLTMLPPEIGKLTLLAGLAVSGNRLTTLPAKIWKLTSLRELDLSANKLKTLPAEVGNLTSLTQLDLSLNEIETLPPEIRKLTSLTHLDVMDNHLTGLPSEIGALSSLVVLNLRNNQLKTLPPEIEKLKWLIGLFLQGNQTLNIPEPVLGPTRHEVITKGKEGARPADILNYYFAKTRGAAAGTLREVNEIKVMLVGRGGAGKTSLRRFLLGQPHRSAEEETRGIALDTFQARCGGREVTVRLWDFAGQEITHALHQFFLTEGCVYVLVLDPRSNTEMRDAEYWLGLLRRYADSPPVVVALNRQDARQGGYDVDRRPLRERFPFIRDFIPTNCETRMGCGELHEALHGMIAALGELEPPNLPVPEAWLKVMRECFDEGRPTQEKPGLLQKMLGLAGHTRTAAPGRQHLTLDEFREICARHGETKADEQESLARLLHKLGAVLHFVDEPRLRDTTVLNPHWVTDGVYRLLRCKDRPGSDGTVTLAEAVEALPGESEETARFFLRLMERFEMCFPVDGQDGAAPPVKWLIPGALNEFQPEEVGPDWQRPGSVRLRYVYDPLPEGVLPRFIVMTHLLSEGKARWRRGVVLEDGGATALVRRGEKENLVEVIAFGPDGERLRLLEIVQGTLDRINADLPEPRPVAELELAGLPGVFRSIADLEAAELSKVSVAIDTPPDKKLVEPTPQLNRTSEPESRKPERVPLNVFLSYAHEDKRAKLTFQNNLTVMMKKKFITPWHDGRIEPGMRWREEIGENLERMDVFVGLLTTAFLASDFIETVEIKAARERLREKGREFLFVLILVDDVSLDGLDLAEYQMLVPGGKAVCKHARVKDGFNVAQKELEALIVKRQKAKREEPGMETFLERQTSRAQQAEGVTLIGKGGTIDREEPMSGESGELANCTNMIRQQAPGARKDLLETLEREVRELIAKLPVGKRDEAAGNLELMVKAAIVAPPNRRWYNASAEGLIEDARFAAEFSGNIAGTIGSLGKLLWPDFPPPTESDPR